MYIFTTTTKCFHLVFNINVSSLIRKLATAYMAQSMRALCRCKMQDASQQ